MHYWHASHGERRVQPTPIVTLVRTSAAVRARSTHFAPAHERGPATLRGQNTRSHTWAFPIKHPIVSPSHVHQHLVEGRHNHPLFHWHSSHTHAPLQCTGGRKESKGVGAQLYSSQPASSTQNSNSAKCKPRKNSAQSNSFLYFHPCIICHFASSKTRLVSISNREHFSKSQ